MLWEGLKTARDLGRLHDVASVLIRYGFGDIVRRLGLGNILERAGRVLHWKGTEDLARLSPPARLCRIFEELGPCYIKLGQIMATRMDLFPRAWTEELEKLQDRAPALDFATLRPQLEEDLGGAPESLFPDLDVTPLATASIAQVHRATLPDGTPVVLKIRRPGIRDIIETDMRLLERLAEIANTRLPDLQRYRLPDVVRQFKLSIRRELDLASEGRNSERIARSFGNVPWIVIPRVYWQWTCERLNVQEYVPGIRGRNLAELDAAGLDRRLLARRGAEAVMKMVLEDAFFHADPHLGNFFCLSDNRLALLDFGMVGRLSQERREQVVVLLHGLVARNTAEVVDVLTEWAGDTAVDVDALAAELDAFLDHYHGLPLQRLDLGAILVELVTLMRDYHLVLPPDLALLFKALLTLDGVGRHLDPEFDLVETAGPFVERLMLARYMPTAVAQRSLRHARALGDLLAGLPDDARRILRLARRGALQINIDMSRLDHFGHQLDRAASRMTIGILTAAIIVGSSIVMTVESGVHILGMPVIGFVGFLGACVGAIWLLISIVRSGRE